MNGLIAYIKRIMHGISKPYSVNGLHYSSLESAITEAKKIVLSGNGINLIHVTLTTNEGRVYWLVSVVNRELEICDILEF